MSPTDFQLWRCQWMTNGRVSPLTLVWLLDAVVELVIAVLVVVVVAGSDAQEVRSAATARIMIRMMGLIFMPPSLAMQMPFRRGSHFPWEKRGLNKFETTAVSRNWDAAVPFL